MDKTSWVLLFVAVISLILCIIAIAAQKYAFIPLLGFSTVFFQVFYDRLKVKRSSYDVIQRDRLSNNKLKPELDKYEITLLTVLNSILLVVTAELDGFISINYSFLMPLIIVVGALLLMGIVYHTDRKNAWKKRQQALTPSTLQN
jgi:uncharacterized membrane protein